MESERLKYHYPLKDKLKIKVGIVGSRKYTNSMKVKDVIFILKEKYGDKLIIVSGGAKYGADYLAKKHSLNLGVKYEEYNPAHTPKNPYSVMPNTYYNKPYHVTQFFHRNELIAENIDVLIAFIPEGIESKGTLHTISKTKELNKPVILMD